MLRWFGRNNKYHTRAQALYTAIMAQSRKPDFYGLFEVPDTLDGRFELILLHTAPLHSRLYTLDNSKISDALSQALFDVVFRDMDMALREIGIGDMGIRKHAHRMMTAYKGRIFAYCQARQDDLSAAETGTGKMKQALRRNLYGTVPDVAEDTLSTMAGYTHTCFDVLAAINEHALIEGEVSFAPAPAGADSLKA